MRSRASWERRLRVVHLITRLELGGAQRNTLHTVAHLDRRRFRPALVCGRGGLLDGEAAASGVPVTFLDCLVRPVRPARDLAALVRLTALWRRQRPDIVHTHSSKAGVLGRLSAHLAGVPVVVHTVHGFGFHPGQPAPVRSAFAAAERLVAPLTTHFVLVSEANRRQGIALGLFRPEKASLIRSGVDLHRFRGARPDREGLARHPGIPRQAPLVGMVACLKPQKAPLDFVEVARRVSARHPGAHFLLVGDGDLRARTQEEAEAAGLQGRFHLLGWRQDVDRILKSLDVLVHSSRWEGLPRVLLEALVAGVPVVATRVDGAGDVVRHGENGYLLEAGDVEGLAARTAELLGDEAARRRLGAGGLREEGQFHIDRMVELQERLYLRLWKEATERRVGGTTEERLVRSGG